MTSSSQNGLIKELLADPQRFVEEGRSYALLQDYFGNLEVETLVPLLRSPNVWVQRAAGFVASELGAKAQPLIREVVPLLDSSDPIVQNYAMEVVAVCANDETFASVATKLESANWGLRLQAMSLLANAQLSQLRAAAGFFQRMGSQGHMRGLRLLMSDAFVASNVRQHLDAAEALVQLYAAIAVKRFNLQREFEHQTNSSSNSDVREFLKVIR